jgi:hypothetical protein
LLPLLFCNFISAKFFVPFFSYTFKLPRFINEPKYSLHLKPTWLLLHLTSVIYSSLDEDKWKLYRRTDGGAIQEYTVPFQNLVPETTYSFRVIAYNEFGISPPCTSEEEVRIFQLLSYFCIIFCFFKCPCNFRTILSLRYMLCRVCFS